MRVLYGKGPANHTGPESCVSHHEVRHEALTGEYTGQPLSRERVTAQGADTVDVAEGNTARHAIASVWTTLRSQRTWHVCTLSAREPADLLLDRLNLLQGGPHREGEEP